MANTHDEQLALAEADDEMIGLGDGVRVAGNNDVVFEIERLGEVAADTRRSIAYRGRFRCLSYLNVPPTRQI